MREAIAALQSLELACDEEEVRGALLAALPYKHTLAAMAPALSEARERLRAYKRQKQQALEDAARKQQASKEEDDRACVVCFERERALAFVPCGHRAVCDECAARLQQHALAGSIGLVCPVCRTASNAVIRVFG